LQRGPGARQQGANDEGGPNDDAEPIGVFDETYRERDDDQRQRDPAVR
jgi:hypothetical protein